MVLGKVGSQSPSYKVLQRVTPLQGNSNRGLEECMRPEWPDDHQQGSTKMLRYLPMRRMERVGEIMLAAVALSVPLVTVLSLAFGQ
jgi:hypothetical protein